MFLPLSPVAGGAPATEIAATSGKTATEIAATEIAATERTSTETATHKWPAMIAAATATATEQ